MPISKSAQKQVRVAERSRVRNKSIRSLCKTNITKAEKLILSGELELAREAAVIAASSLDRAAEKGVFHSNNAARRKSRLMKKLNKALALSSAEAEPEEKSSEEKSSEEKSSKEKSSKGKKSKEKSSEES